MAAEPGGEAHASPRFLSLLSAGAPNDETLVILRERKTVATPVPDINAGSYGGHRPIRH